MTSDLLGIDFAPLDGKLWLAPYAVTGGQSAPTAWGWKSPAKWRGEIVRVLFEGPAEGMTLEELERAGIKRWAAIAGTAFIRAGGDMEQIRSRDKGACLYRLVSHA